MSGIYERFASGFVALGVLALVLGLGMASSAAQAAATPAPCYVDEEGTIVCIAAKCDDTCNGGSTGYVDPVTGAASPCGDKNGTCKKLGTGTTYRCDGCTFTTVRDTNGLPTACKATCTAVTITP